MAEVPGSANHESGWNCEAAELQNTPRGIDEAAHDLEARRACGVGEFLSGQSDKAYDLDELCHELEYIEGVTGSGPTAVPDGSVAWDNQSDGSQLSMAPKGEEMLRAIPASAALRRCGQMLRSDDCASVKHSRVVEEIADFWSYSRHASAVSNICMLLVFYNGPVAVAAGTATTLAASVFMLLPWEAEPTYNASLIALMAGIAASIVTLCTWPSSQKVFLDKACISQNNEMEKRNGILSLGYFLKSSRRLVILWDRTYFTRLWCVFELAVFLKLQKEGNCRNKLKVLPTAWGTGAAGFFCSCGVFFTFARTLQVLVEGKTASYLQVVAICAPIAGFLTNLVVVQRIFAHISVFNGLRSQLEVFSVRDAKCFCCSAGHVHPQTGMPLRCDREMIEKTIVRWFGTTDAFDSFVRAEVGKSVHCKPHLPYRLALLAGTPIFWYGLGNHAQGLKTGGHLLMAQELPKSFISWVVYVPMFLAMMLKICNFFIARLGATRRSQVLCSICVTLVLAISDLMWRLADARLGWAGFCVVMGGYALWNAVTYSQHF